MTSKQYVSFLRNPAFFFIFIIIGLLYMIYSTINRQQQVYVALPAVTAVKQPPKIVTNQSEGGQMPVWDTMDGIGYKFEKEKQVVMDPRFEELNKLPLCDLLNDKIPPKIDISKIMDSFQQCITPIVNKWKNDVPSINSKWRETEKCDNIFKDIPIVPMANLHEVKWTILPTCEKQVVMDPRFEELNKLPLCDLLNDKIPTKIDISKIMESFQQCITPIVNKWKNDVSAINSKWRETEKCDYIFKDIPIVPMANLHEVKWTILPTCKEENIMVTLGIGHDTMAEEKLNKTLPNTKFFGADPIIEPNRQLYTAFGKYFPFAIGKNPGFTKFRVLPNQNQKTRKYEYQDVTTIPFTYFLSDVLGLKKIDIAWIDIEGGEFEFLDQLHKGGPLDEKGISICQFNLEVHSKFHPPGAQIYHDFIFKVLEDKRYVFLKPAHTEAGVHRMFFINFENQQCIRKFLQ